MITPISLGALGGTLVAIGALNDEPVLIGGGLVIVLLAVVAGLLRGGRSKE